MRTLPIEGRDISNATPVNGIFHVGAFIRSPQQQISIKWEVGGYSGSTECQAWEGQHEIDQLTKSGYQVLSIENA